MIIKGSIVAIVTPMHLDGSVDYDGLRRLVDWHIEKGTDAIVSVGTTGESPTLAVPEHLDVIKVAVAQTAGRIPVIAGAGSNSTAEAIDYTKEAKTLGADATLQVVPYYNKPTQEGMYQHFRAIADAVDLPVILYNVPGRTIADMSNDTALRLAEIDRVIGIKDATGDMERGKQLIAKAPQDFAVYSGDDPTAMELMLAGAQGDISVTANVLPAEMSKLCELAMAGSVEEAKQLDAKLQPLHSGLFIEPSPAAAKWALSEMGLIENGIRLPLLPLTNGSIPEVRKMLEDVSAL